MGFDLVVVETAGIGQSDTEIVDLADLSLYVMTAEYGAASQLEKIDMLDFADMIVLNKFEKRGAEDALRDVRKQWRRNHPEQSKLPDADMPVFPTIASRFNDPGVNRLFLALCAALDRECGAPGRWTTRDGAAAAGRAHRIPLARSADSRRARALSRGNRRAGPRSAHASDDARAGAAQRAHGLYLALAGAGRPAPAGAADAGAGGAPATALRRAAQRLQPCARRYRRRRRLAALRDLAAAARRHHRGRVLLPRCAAARCAAPTTPNR